MGALEAALAVALLAVLVVVCPILWIVALTSDADPVVRFLSLVLALAISAGVAWAALVQLSSLARWLSRRRA